MADALLVTGAALNFGGILIALLGLFVESRERRWPLLARNRRAIRSWLRRQWRRWFPRAAPSVSVSTRTDRGGRRRSGIGVVAMQRPVDPDASLPEILDALQHNMRELVLSSERKQDWQRKRESRRQSRRIEGLSHRLDDLREERGQEALRERRIAARSLRTAAWGLVIALLGTGLGCVGALLS